MRINRISAIGKRQKSTLSTDEYYNVNCYQTHSSQTTITFKFRTDFKCYDQDIVRYISDKGNN